jgi:hypothetical protein
VPGSPRPILTTALFVRLEPHAFAVIVAAQDQGAMALAWEKAPPGSAAPKTAQTYEERHAQETAAKVESFRRLGLTLQLGSDTTGLIESEVGS